MEASRNGGSLFSGFADRVIDAVAHGGMSRQGAAERFGVSGSVAIKWVERFERTGLRTAGKMGGHKRLKLEPHREFLEACHAEKPDVTLQALCDRLLGERAVKADTSLMSRFLRRIGFTLKKRRSSPANKTVPT
jgi:transposase